ncbi:MAG: nicotinate phosphoribosyltransferase [Selenomonas sp.]|uniref:nicotinate phosphoribosyltransferase n=1 Tax=unclassified Selenomonas TaxID=2637378 RepID=UPI0004954087|nr:nicotinate phosphoribosyltransferase [Selenomonas sp.]SEH20753.1 nicotinate phosphoribosyltransferase [Selenomonas ruminantium]
MTQFDKRNISMMMDFYEMTMSYGYFNDHDTDTKVVFDVFYRQNPDGGGFAIFAGLEQVIEYVENMRFSEDDIEYFRQQNMFSEEFLAFLRDFRFHGDIYAMPEGTVMYPNEPILTVVGSLIDAQLVETAILAQINHQSLIATKARRIVKAAGEGRAVSDFGARRAHNMDAATYGARAAYIGGVVGTATVSAGQMFDIPVSGTMAHSWVMFYGDEYEAFRHYAENYPDATVLLVDTYDVIHSGIPNAIRVAREVLEPMGKRLKGIRIDSGDLAYLSKRVRKMLDEAGLEDCMIVVSNSLDEFTIASLLSQGACIDSFGVGERLITAKSEPVFGAVYKLAAVGENGNFSPRIKVSENVEKITNPGLKDLYRVYDKDGHAVADMLAVCGEKVDMEQPFRYVDPQKPWKNRNFEGCTVKNLRRLYVQDGKRTQELPTLGEIRDYVKSQLKEEIWEEEQRFENPHRHYLDMTPDYYEMKMELLSETRKQHG